MENGNVGIVKRKKIFLAPPLTNLRGAGAQSGMRADALATGRPECETRFKSRTEGLSRCSVAEGRHTAYLEGGTGGTRAHRRGCGGVERLPCVGL